MLATLGLLAAAATVPVRLELLRKPSVDAAAGGTLILTPAMGPAAPITIECCNDAATVALPPNSAWELQPHLHGTWAAREMIVVGDGPTTHSVTLWPVASLTGRVQLQKQSALPRTVEVILLDPPGRRSGIAPGNSVECPVAPDATFTCVVPALALDLGFAAAGYIPSQLWDVDLRGRGTRDVGPIVLRKGASVSGWVQNGGGAATVTIVPLVATGGATSERVARPVATTTTLGNGFFQLGGVPPGQYTLRVDRAGYASATAGPVVVYEASETAIRKTIVLQPPVNVALSVVPPLDWRGEPWSVWIAKASPISGGFDAAPIFRGRTADGRVVLRGQGAARYSIDIFDSAGNPLKNEQFDVDGAADLSRQIRVDVISVHGAITIGDVPLETTLWFGGRHGAQHATMRADAKGNFHGVLPHDGDWRVTVVVDGNDVETNVDVHAREGDAAVEIALPDNAVAGVVVDGDGNPVAAADVTLMTARTSTTHRSDREGKFSFRALENGDVSLTANVTRSEKVLTSDAVTTHVSADLSPPQVQLVVHEGQRLTGTVQSIHGPIPGAAVTIVPMLDQTLAATATTDFEGHFKALIAGNADRAYVTVRPPGHSLRVFDVPLPNHGIGLNVPISGGTLDLVFPKIAAGNVALLLFQDDRPLPLPELARWAMSHGAPPSNDGIHAADMAPAQYRACIGFQQLLRREELPRWIAAARCVTGNLAPFGELRLEIPSPALR